jgi:dUTP pyrophosphatase
MNISICKLHPNAITPTYGSEGAACFDLYAATVNGHANIGDVVYAGHPVIVDTGLAFEVPQGWMLKIHPRSGLKFAHGVEAFSGVIDSDFRGSVQILLESADDNDDTPPLRINPGDRVAQASMIPSSRVTFHVVEQLSITERGEGGFWSTGK